MLFATEPNVDANLFLESKIVLVTELWLRIFSLRQRTREVGTRTLVAKPAVADPPPVDAVEGRHPVLFAAVGVGEAPNAVAAGEVLRAEVLTRSPDGAAVLFRAAAGALPPPVHAREGGELPQPAAGGVGEGALTAAGGAVHGAELPARAP